MMRSTAFALLLLVLTSAAVLASPAARADETKPEERWYILEMQGQRAGWMHERVREEAGKISSESKMRLTIKRGEVGITIKVESQFVETADGKPVSMKSMMQLGALPTATEYTFHDDGVSVTTTVGKAPPTEKEKQPLPEGEWMTPRHAERHTSERIAAGDKTVSVRSLDASMGLKAIRVTNELIEKTNLEVVGKTVPALKWKSTMDAYPDMPTTAFTNEQGHPLRTETDVGGIKLIMVLADRDLALAKVDPPELLVSTLIKPDRPIEQPRTLQRAVYLLRSTGDTLPDIPSVGSQKFERLDAASGRLIVDLASPSPAPESEVGDKRYTDCSNMITCGDEDVQALAARALKDAKLTPESAAAERAEALRAFVYGFIDKKSLGVGFASAAEVADTRTGDCSEHGVLLCALMRASGIPSQVVSGVVYVDGFAGEQTVFGYHMWTQALLERNGKKCWVDFDAALSATHPSDATHIALSPSALGEDDTANALVKLAPLFGTLKIEVKEPE